MTAKLKFIVQAVIAGMTAALMLLGVQNLVSQAQDGGDPPPEESGSAPDGGADPAVESITLMSDVDPCTLLTAEEASAVLGAPVIQQSGNEQCAYVADDLSGRALSVAAPLPVFAQQGLESVMASLADVLTGEHRTAQIGEEAAGMYSESLAQMAAMDGDRIVLVTMVLPEGGIDQQHITLSDLTSTALSRR